jgi:hypothetical protein
MGYSFSRGALALGMLSSLSGLSLGCSAAHAPTEVSSGIYELSVTPERDACSPARSTGVVGRVAVVSSDDVLNIGLADGARVSLSQATGFHGVHEVPIASCEGASLRREWTVVGSQAGGFSLAYAEEWLGMAGCTSPSMPEAPDFDCRADLVLDYARMEACEAPCELRLATSGPTCSCE